MGRSSGAAQALVLRRAPTPQVPSQAVKLAISILAGLLVGQALSTTAVFQPTARASVPSRSSPSHIASAPKVEDAGNGQVKIQFPPGTPRLSASIAGTLADLTLVDGDPTIGLYFYDLPRVQVEMLDSTTARLQFPSIALEADVAKYLAENQLTLIRWDTDRRDPGTGIVAIVRLPVTIVTPRLVDRLQGIFELTLPIGLDRARILAWASGAGYSLISYDPATGRALLRLLGRRLAPTITRRATIPRPPAPPPAARSPGTTPLYVRLSPNISDASAIGNRVGITLSPIAGTDLYVGSPPSSRASGILQLLSDLSEVVCVADTEAACQAIAAPAAAPPNSIVTAASPPTYAPPGALTVTPGADGAHLSWASATGASAYLVVREAGGGSTILARIAVSPAQLAYLDAAEPAGASSYRVAALHGCADAGPGCDGLNPVIDPGLQTPMVTVTSVAINPQTTAPAVLEAPQSLNVTASDGHVQLQWQAVTGAESYRVYRGIGAAASILDATTTEPKLVDVGAGAGQDVTYVVAAVAAGGREGAPSATTNTTWVAAASNPVIERSLPAAADHLSGIVRLQVDAKTGDGSGQADWHLSGPRAALEIGSAAGFTSKFDRLAWSAARNWDSTSVPDGTYTLAVIVTDSAGHHNQITQTFRVENGAPSAPTQLTATAQPSGVDLTWDQAPSADAALYRVYRDVVGPGAPLAEVPLDRRTFEDVNVAVGKHHYELVLVDRAGHASRVAAADTVIQPVAPVAPIGPPVLAIQAILPSGEALAQDGRVTDRILLVSSQAPTGARNMRFEYSADGQTWTPIKGATCAQTCSLDWSAAALPPGPYLVRAAFDLSGQASIISAAKSFILQPAVPLVAPLNPSATVTSQGVALAWTLPDGLFPTAYAISRQDGGGWQTLTRLSGRTSYLDEEAPTGAVVSYRVEGLDRDGTPGTPSTEAVITPAAIIPALGPGAGATIQAPTGLRILIASGHVTLVWNPTPGADGYIVRRSLTPAGPGQLVARTASVTMLVDSAGPIGGQVYYTVSAFSGSGQSPTSAPIGALLVPAPGAVVAPPGAPASPDLPPSVPAATPSNPSATVTNGSIQLSWSESALPQTPLSYSVYRFDPADSSFVLAQSSLPTPTFTDAGLTGGATFGYAVTAVGPDGRESGFSAPVWVTAPPGADATLSLIAPTPPAQVLGGTGRVSLVAQADGGLSGINFAYGPPGGPWTGIPGSVPLNLPANPSSAIRAGTTDWIVSWNTSSLPAGQYQIKLSATDAAGRSVDQTQGILIGGPTARAPPASALDLMAAPLANGVRLTWTAAQGSTYQVLRSNFGTAGPFEPIGQTSTGSFEDRNLIPQLSYQYRVVLAIGDAVSPVLSATPLASPAPATAIVPASDVPPTVTLAPASAAGLAISIVSTDSIPSLPAGYAQLGAAYRIDATSLASGVPVHRLDEAATMRYPLGAGTSQALAASIRLMHWDEITQGWVIAGGAADTANTFVTARLQHFSLFALVSITAQADPGPAAQPPVAPIEFRGSGPPGTTSAPANLAPLPAWNVAPDGEILNLRTTTTAAYLKPSGGIREIVNSVPVNFQDQAGTWQKIDPTLVLRNDGTGAYHNRAGAVDVQLPGYATDGPISVARAGSRVSMELEGHLGSHLQTAQNVGRYLGILPGLDAEYWPLGYGLKESLVLTSAQSPRRIAFTIESGAYKLRLNGDGSISGLDAAGVEQFTFAGPSMTEAQTGDSAPASTQAIAVSLSGNAGHYRVVYAPDAAWLAAPTRHYPVIIDPTVTFQHQGQNDGEDNHVDSYSNGTHNNGYDAVGVDATVGVMRTYARFWPMMSDGRYTTNATFNIYQYTNYRLGGLGINLWAAAGPWTRGGITWGNQPGGINVYTARNSLNGTGWLTFNITQLVQDWERNGRTPSRPWAGSSDWGIALTSTNEGAAPNTTEFFYSSVNGNLGGHAYMQFDYDDWGYDVVSASLSTAAGWVPNGGSSQAQVVLRNRGTANWDSNISLSYSWLKDGSTYTNFDWPPGGHIHIPQTVAPQGVVTLNFPLYAPAPTTGNLQLEFSMVKEGIFWFHDIAWGGPAGLRWFNNGATMPIAPESYTMSAAGLPAVVDAQAGSLITIPITVSNPGSSGYTWSAANYNDLTRVGIRAYRHLDGSLAGSVPTRTAFSQDVAPGQSATVNTLFQAPTEPGDYVFRFDLVHEHLAASPGLKDGTIIGMTYGTTSPLTNTPGTALAFNGTSNYVKATNWLASQTGWSVEAWINPSTQQNSLAVYNGDNSGGYGFGVGNAGGGVGQKLQGLFGNVAWIDSGYTFPVLGQWYHVVMTNDGYTTRFYVNGVQTSGTSTLVPKSLAAYAYGSIGGLLSGGSPNLFFNGSISDAATYADPLAPSRILAHYRAASAPTTPNAYQSAVASDQPISYYRLNDGGGSVARESTGPIWFEDRGNQPLEVRVRVLAPGEDKAAHTPVTLSDGSNLGINTSNGFASLDASDLNVTERVGASLQINRTYNGVNGALPANGTAATSATYGQGWSFDFQRTLTLGQLGAQTRGQGTGLLTDGQGRTSAVRWNPQRGLFEDAAGNRTIKASPATVTTPNNPATGITVPGVTPVDLVGAPAILASPPAGSPRNAALSIGPTPTALVFPQGTIPAQQNGSIEFWFYPNFAIGTSTTPEQMFFSDTSGRFWLAWNDQAGTQKLDFYTFDADTGVADRLLSVQAVTTVQWHYVAVTWVENGTKQLTVDGQTATSSGNHGQSPIGEVLFGYNPSWTGSGPSYALNADLAELRIEGRVLSSTDMTQDGTLATSRLSGDANTLYLGAFTGSSGFQSLSGVYTLVNADQSQQDYFPWGPLRQERDRQGNAIDYCWTTSSPVTTGNCWDMTSSRLTAILDDALPSRAITLSYGTPPANSNCQPSGSVFALDPAGRCVTYTVNNYGDLTSVTRSNQVPNPTTGNVTTSQPATTTYTYSPAHVLQQITEPSTSQGQGQITINPQLSYRLVVSGDAPAAYYQLDEPSGSTVAADSAGIGHTGTIVGGVSGVPGALGAAAISADSGIQFNGTNGYIALSPALDPVFQNHDFTVEAWASFSDSPSADRAIFGIGNTTTDQFLHLVKRGGKAYMGFFSDDMSGNATLALNRWYHLVFTWSASTKVRSIYVNGTLDATAASSGALNVPNGSVPQIGWTWGTGYMYGGLDDIAIYNIALSASRVQAHYAAGLSAATTGSYTQAVLTDAPVAYYPLDDPAGASTVRDASIQRGSVNGGVTSGVAGAFPGESAIQFDGMSGGITLPTALSTTFQNHDFTVEGWAYFTDASTADRAIFGAGAVATDQGLHLVRRNNTAYMGFYADDMTGVRTLSPNQWWHLAFTWVAATKQRTVYVNGAIDAQGTSSGALNIPIGSASYIGRLPWSAFMTGSLDEMAVYPIALTQAQVQAHYAATSISAYRQAVTANSPFGYYALDDSTLQSVTNTVTGTETPLIGGVTAGVSGGIANDTGMQFDGSTGYVQASGNWLSSVAGWTLEAWIKPAAAQNSLAVYNGNDAGGYGFGVGNGAGTGAGLVLDGLFGGVAWPTSGSTLTANTWYHVAMTNDGATTRFYLNGSQTPTIYTASQPHAPAAVATIGTQLNSVGNRDFNGAISEVAVYASALPASSILTHYNAGSGSSNSVATYRATIQQDAPVAFYPLNEGPVQAVNTGLGNTGALVGGVTPGASGGLTARSDAALKLDGTTGEVDTRFVQSAVSSYAIEAWVKTTDGTKDVTIAEDRGGVSGSGTGQSITLGLNSTGSNPGAPFIAYDTNNVLVGVYSQTVINDGLWHHLVGTWTWSGGAVASGQFLLFLDGAPLNTVAIGTTGPTPPLSGLGGLKIGAHDAWNTHLNGTIEDVAIYASASPQTQPLLSAARILAHYNANTSPAAYQSAVLADAPAAFYRLSESGNGPAADSSLTGTGGLIGSGVTLGVAGALPTNLDRAMQFNGTTTSSISLNLPASVPASSSVTVELWTYHTGINNIMPFGFANFDLFHVSNALGFNTGNSDLWGVADTTSGFTANTWHYVVAIFNTTPKNSQLWIDGTQQTLTQIVGITPATTSISANAQIGNWALGNGNNYNWVGGIDEVAVYTSALTASQIEAHYYAARDQIPLLNDRPLAYYRLNELTGTVAADSSGNGANGTIGSAVTEGIPGALPNSSTTAMQFNGAAGSTITITLPASVTSAAAATVDFWTFVTAGVTGTIMPFGFNMYDLVHQYDTNRRDYELGFNTGNSDVWGVLDTPAGFTANRWHHVVAIFNNGNPQLNKLWVDGVAQTLSQLVGTTTTSGHVLTTAAQISGWPTNASNYWVGGIDELAIYPYALSATQAQGQDAAMLNMTPDRVGSAKDAMGNVTSWVYNDSAATTQVINALGQSSFFTFQSYGGRTLSTTDNGGNVTTYVWDTSAAYRMTGVVSPTGVRQSQVVNGNGLVGEQAQLLTQDTAAHPADNRFDYVNGAFPSLAQPFNTAGNNTEPWIWDPGRTFQAGKLTHVSSPMAGTHQHGFQNAAPLAIPAGATATQWVYIEPGLTAPVELMLQFLSADGSWEHRAYWGMDLTGWGVDGSPSRRPMGAVPTPGRWIALTIPLGPSEWGKSDVDLANRSLTGIAWTVYNGSGRVWWGPLSFDFPSPSVADPQRSITRYAYNAKSEQIAVVDPNGIATISDVDTNGLVRQVASGVETAAPPSVFADPLAVPANWRFEYGYGPATTSGSVVQHKGVGSLQQTQTSAGSESDLYRDIDLYRDPALTRPAPPGTYLKVSVWVLTIPNPNISSGAGSGGASLWLEDGTASLKDGVPAQEARVSAAIQTPAGVWEQLTLPFLVDESAKLRIHLVQSNFAGATIWADLQVVDITPVPSVTMQHPASLYSTDFEQPVASTNWTFNHSTSAGGGFVVDPTLAHGGSTAVKLTVIRTNSNAYWEQVIQNISPNTTYRATVWMKSIASGSVTATTNFDGPSLQAHDNATPSQVFVKSSWIRTEGQWQQLEVDLTTGSNASTLSIDLMSVNFQGDTYWDDLVVQQTDGAGGWNGGWVARTNGGTASWNLSASGGFGALPARDVHIATSTIAADVTDSLATAPLRQGATYVISVWASTTTANSSIDVSIQDASGNRLPTDFPSTCQLAVAPNQTLCQNSFTYTSTDLTSNQLVMGYGGWSGRDVFVSHPVVALSSQVTSYTPYGQVTDVTDLFGHEQRTDYDSNGLYPVQVVDKASSGYSTTVMADRPLSYWRLGELSGPTAADSIGTSPAMIAPTGVTLFQPGGLFGDNNRAMSFDGSSGYVSVANGPANGSFATWSAEAWIKADAFNGYQRILSDGYVNTGTGNPGYEIVLDPSGNVFASAAVGSSNTATFAGTSSTQALRVGAWHYIAATWDGSLLLFYVDGVQVGVGSGSGSINPGQTALQIGRASSNNANFKGAIDDVAIYSSRLSATQILTHYLAGRAQNPGGTYTSGVVADNPAAYWRLGEVSGTTSADQQGANPGTYQGGYALGTTGAPVADSDTAVTFDGTSGYVQAPYSATLNPSQLTLEAWVYPTGGVGTYRSVLASRNVTGTVDTGYQIYAAANDQWQVWLGSGGATWTAVYGPPVTLNTWTHIAASYDGATLSLYINGQLYTTQAGNYGPNTSMPLRIGAGSTEGAAAYFFPGAIDEVAVYSRALSAARIQGHYSLGRAGTSAIVRREQYDAVGQLLSSTEVSGGQQVVDTNLFDSWGRVAAEIKNAMPGPTTDAVTNVRTGFGYDALGNQTDRYDWSASTGTWIQTHYVYDLNNNQTQVWQNYVNGGNGVTVSQNVETVYTYDVLDRQIAKQHPPVTPGAQQVTDDTVYDNAGRVINQILNNGPGAQDSQTNVTTRVDYDADGRVIATYTPVGTTATVQEIKSTKVYDALGRLITSVAAAVAPAGLAAAPAQTDYTLDPGGRVTDVLSAGTGNAAARIRTHTDFDALNRALAVTQNCVDAVNQQPGTACGGTADSQTNVTIRTTYDPRGASTTISPPTFSQAAGVPTRTETDLLGHTIRVVAVDMSANPGPDVKVTTTAVYDGFGRATDVTNPIGIITHTTYDALDRVTAVTKDVGTGHLNQTWQYTWNLAGDQTQVTWPNGRVDVTSFDALHRPTSITQNYVAGQASTFEQNVSTSSTYDSEGRTLTATDALGRVSQTSYDALGRTVALTANYCTTSTAVCTNVIDYQDNLTTRYSLDKSGQILTMTTPNTVQTAYAYDAQLRLVTVTLDATGLAQVTRYSYDPDGHRLSETDGLIHTTTVTLDALGRMVKVQDPVQLAANTGVQTQYSPAGEVTATITAQGKTSSRVLDNLGRVLAQNYVKSDGATAGSLHYVYDAVGQRTSFWADAASCTAPNCTSVSYDGLGRVLSVTGPSTTSYAYSADLKNITVNDITGQTIFNLDALLRSKTTQDPLDGTPTTQYTLDAGSRLRARTEANGSTTNVQYSNVDQILQQSVTASGATVPFASWVTPSPNPYDLNGNRLGETVTLPGDTYAGPATFTYDSLDRLSTANQPGTGCNLTYGYDAANNRTSVSGGPAPRCAATFRYDLNEALLYENPGPSQIPYAPNLDGNITKDAAGRNLHYDSLNRLQEVRDAATDTTVLDSYVYDAIGRLITRTDSVSGVTAFLYRGLEPYTIQEQNGSGVVQRNYAVDLTGRVLTVQIGATLYHLVTNLHGDIVALATGTGIVIGWAHYDPWGQVIGGQWSGTSVPFGFQGQYTEATTGFVLMGGRWYDPHEGRFITEDPAGSMGDPRNPLDEGLWTYGQDNPERYNDPTGLWPWDNVAKWASNTWNSMTHWVSNSWDSFSSWASDRWDDGIRSLRRARDDVVRTFNNAVTTVQRGVQTARSWVRTQVSRARTAFKMAVNHVAHMAAAARKAAFQGASMAIKGVTEFAKAAWKPAVSIAAGALAFGGCMLVTAGAGSAGCVVVGFAVGGAVAGALNCPPGRSMVQCVGVGAAAGAVGGLVFVATGGMGAGIAGSIVAGALSGGASNIVEQGLNTGHVDPGEVAISMAFSGLTAGAFKAAGGLFKAPALRTRLSQDASVNPTAPRALPLKRPIGASPTQNAAAQQRINELTALKARDFRINQQQVNIAGERVGLNRPDLQYTLNRVRHYEEWDTESSGRGPGHEYRILANDPEGQVRLWTVN